MFDAGLDIFAFLHAVLRFVQRRGHLDVPCKRALSGGGYCPRVCPRYLLPLCAAQTINASTVGQESYPSTPTI